MLTLRNALEFSLLLLAAAVTWFAWVEVPL
jgi:hypothetical protein